MSVELLVELLKSSSALSLLLVSGYKELDIPDISLAQSLWFSVSNLEADVVPEGPGLLGPASVDDSASVLFTENHLSSPEALSITCEQQQHKRSTFIHYVMTPPRGARSAAKTVREATKRQLSKIVTKDAYNRNFGSTPKHPVVYGLA